MPRSPFRRSGQARTKSNRLLDDRLKDDRIRNTAIVTKKIFYLKNLTQPSILSIWQKANLKLSELGTIKEGPDPGLASQPESNLRLILIGTLVSTIVQCFSHANIIYYVEVTPLYGCLTKRRFVLEPLQFLSRAPISETWFISTT